ncbi:unnamed protein product, partial [Closterium sp. NIES-65]
MRPHRRSRRCRFTRLRHPSSTSPRLPLPFPSLAQSATSCITRSLGHCRCIHNPRVPLSPHLPPLPSSPFTP